MQFGAYPIILTHSFIAMYCNISVVYSSHLGEIDDQKFENMLNETSGLSIDQLEILRFENFNQFSLTEVYNIGMKESKYPIVLFIHNDTRFVKEGWGTVLLDKFNTSDYGILGLAGTNKIMKDQQGRRFSDGEYTYAGFVYHPDGLGGMEEAWQSNKLSFIVPAVAIDGVFMAVAKERTVMGFDEDFKSFHFYDISFCIRNYEEGVKIGIISDFSIALYHNSKGDFGAEWNKNRLLFISKYKDSYSVPILMDIPANRFEIENFPEQNRIHVIIPTKNKIDLLFQCLESIFEKTVYPYFDVWIADTGSNIESKELMNERVDELNERCKKKYGTLTEMGFNYFNLIEFDYYHYSKVNNEVVKMLESSRFVKKTDFLLFCNNDIQLLNDCISGCICTYYNHNDLKIGTIGIRLHFGDNLVQHCGMEFLKSNNYVYITHKHYKSAYRYITNTERCIGNTGAFMFTPYRVFKDSGMFNEKYIEVYQDVEYNLTCIVKGYTNLFAGNLVAYHYESQTRNDDANKNYNSNNDSRNTFFPFVIRNYRHFQKYFSRPINIQIV